MDRDFSILCSIQMQSGCHPVSYTMDTMVSYTEDAAARV